MNKDMKLILSSIGIIIICGGSLVLGALTAPRATPTKSTPSPQVEQPKKTQDKKPVITTETELLIITPILTSAYPKVATDYTILKPQLHSGKWFTAILTYKGSDVMNRDTLRVLFEKKEGTWVLRTTPPELLLSKSKYTDVPIDILKKVNQPVSLPGTDTSPEINAG